LISLISVMGSVLDRVIREELTLNRSYKKLLKPKKTLLRGKLQPF
jgi:hypothetical protein